MCNTLSTIPEKEKFHFTLEEMNKAIEKGNAILKEFTKQTKDYEIRRKRT